MLMLKGSTDAEADPCTTLPTERKPRRTGDAYTRTNTGGNNYPRPETPA
jgi:hypothetical protein